MASQKQEVSESNDALRSDRVRRRLRVEVGEDVYSSWFARMEIEDCGAESVRLSVPTRFLRNWIQSHYAERLLTLWRGELPTIKKIDLVVRSSSLARRGVADPAACAQVKPGIAARGNGMPRLAMQPGGNARRARQEWKLAARPAAHLLEFSRRPLECARPCRGASGGRFRLRHGRALQSSLCLCLGRSRQDASSAGDRLGWRGQWPPRQLPHRRKIHVRLCRRAQEPVGDRLQGSAARHRRSRHRRFAVPAGQDRAAGILPHPERADRCRPPGRGRRRPCAARIGDAGRARALAARGRSRGRDRAAGGGASPQHPGSAHRRRQGRASRLPRAAVGGQSCRASGHAKRPRP